MSTKGKRVDILNVGFQNRDAGPDFFNAKVRINNVVQVGKVEIHQKGSDWFLSLIHIFSIFELRAKCRRLQQRYGIKVLIIDYLQLMTAGADMRGNREQEVSMISRQLKIIAKELNLSLIHISVPRLSSCSCSRTANHISR